MKLTRRGHLVIWVSAILIASIFTFFTRDICYTGNGYGSCDKWIAQVSK